jgi:uncharacterized protein
MAMQPVSPAERIEVLDALRGAALFGIIAANMRGFNGPLAAYFDHTLMWTDTTSRVAQAFVDLFIQGKFITLFSFMFGIGFAIQMERADRRGVSSRVFYVRRLAVLLLFGILHFVLVWWGDILAPYALLGFVLLLFRNRSQKALWRWSAGLYAYPVLLSGVMLVLHSAGVQIPAPPPTTPEELQRIIGVYAGGSYADIVAQNVRELPFMAFGLVFFYPRVLGLFLFGLWVWREGLVRDLPVRMDLLRRCQKHGLWVGLTFNALAVAVNEIYHPNPIAPSVWGLLVGFSLSIGIPAGSLFYASTLALLWQRVEWRARLRPFAAVGRMALSNYLLQSLVCTTLYYSWGGGFYGRVGPLLGLVPTVAIYSAQVASSVWWLRRFSSGPMEWLWRRLTYGRLTPVARAATVTQ